MAMNDRDKAWEQARKDLEPPPVWFRALVIVVLLLLAGLVGWGLVQLT